MVSLQCQYNTNVESRFSFSRIGQDQFPTLPLKSTASFLQSAKERQQNAQDQHHERSNKLTVAHVTSTYTVKKAQRNKQEHGSSHSLLKSILIPIKTQM